MHSVAVHHPPLTLQAALLLCSCCDAIAVLAGTHLAHDLEVAVLAVKHGLLLFTIYPTLQAALL
jgi:hypothetical protein